MRLICPNCGSQYEIDDALVPDSGRDVECSKCGQVWFQASGRVGSGTAFNPAARPALNRQLHDSVLSVLREEAARELRAREDDQRKAAREQALFEAEAFEPTPAPETATPEASRPIPPAPETPAQPESGSAIPPAGEPAAGEPAAAPVQAAQTGPAQQKGKGKKHRVDENLSLPGDTPLDDSLPEMDAKWATSGDPAYPGSFEAVFAAAPSPTLTDPVPAETPSGPVVPPSAPVAEKSGDSLLPATPEDPDNQRAEARVLRRYRRGLGMSLGFAAVLAGFYLIAPRIPATGSIGGFAEAYREAADGGRRWLDETATQLTGWPDR